MAINYEFPAPWLYVSCRNAIRMAKAYQSQDMRHMRIIWQERAADYRETIIDKMRQRQGWSLAERIVGHKSY